ncbi:hypothetical protein EJB05_13400, partial [Eragrostis curvula]
MAAPPVIVVGRQYCEPRVLPLTVTMKFSGGYTVTDAGGHVVLRMDVPLFSFSGHRILLDAAGLPFDFTLDDIYMGFKKLAICNVYHVLQMNRMKSIGMPIFGVTVFPHMDHAFIAALVVIFHGVITIEARRRQQNK